MHGILIITTGRAQGRLGGARCALSGGLPLSTDGEMRYRCISTLLKSNTHFRNRIQRTVRGITAGRGNTLRKECAPRLAKPEPDAPAAPNPESLTTCSRRGFCRFSVVFRVLCMKCTCAYLFVTFRTLIHVRILLPAPAAFPVTQAPKWHFARGQHSLGPAARAGRSTRLPARSAGDPPLRHSRA